MNFNWYWMLFVIRRNIRKKFIVRWPCSVAQCETAETTTNIISEFLRKLISACPFKFLLIITIFYSLNNNQIDFVVDIHHKSERFRISLIFNLIHYQGHWNDVHCTTSIDIIKTRFAINRIGDLMFSFRIDETCKMVSLK